MTDDQTRPYDTPVPDEPPATPATDTPTAEMPTTATHEADAAPGAAGAPAPPARSGPSRKRLLAGLGIAGVILALTAGVLLFLGGPTTPEVLKYVPADSAVVGELRMDLPGDQMEKLGRLLSHFPGFADQSTLPAKIDEALGRLVSSASGGDADYAADIKPWLNGPLFAATAGDVASADTPRSFLIAATTNGGVSCATTFEGRPVTTETHRGVELTIAQPGDLTLGGQRTCAVDGRFALLGDYGSVKRALDTKADGNGLNTSGAYLAARKALAGEQLATIWLSSDAILAGAPAPPIGIPGLGGLGGRAPDWFMFGARAEDDALVLEMVTAPLPAASGGPSLLPLPPGHASVLAGLAPADSLVYVEAQGAGVSIQNMLTTLRSVPELQAPLAMLDGLARPDDLVGWVQDAAVAVSLNGADLTSGSPRVTVLLSAPDAATATEKVTGLQALLGFLAVGGQGVTVEQVQVGGVTATTVTIADLGALIPPGSIPGGGALPSGELTFSIAAKDRVVYFAVGEGTIEQALGVQPGAGLADSPAFKQAGTRGLANSQTTVYVAAGAAIDLAEPFLPADVAARWATEVKPYVDPIQAIGAWSTSDASGLRFRAVLTVSGP